MTSLAQPNTPPLLRAAQAVAGPSGRDYTATAILGILLIVAVGLMARLDYLQSRWQVGLQQDAAVAVALNDSATGMLVFDASGRIVASNKAARNLLGITENTQHTIHEFHRIEMRSRIDTLFGDILQRVQTTQQGRKYQIDCTIPVPVDNGPRVLQHFQVLVRVAPQMHSEPRIIAFITPQEPTTAIVPNRTAAVTNLTDPALVPLSPLQ